MNSKNTKSLKFISSSSIVSRRLGKSKYSVFILLLSMIGLGIMVPSCDTTDLHKPDVTYLYTYKKDAAIKLDSASENGKAVPVFHFSITSGNKLVFIYRKFISTPKKSTGSNSSVELVFQIPKKARNFSYRSSQLQQIQAFYRRDDDEGIAVKVNNGLIRGEKLSPVAWIIKINVTVSGFGKPVHLKFHQPFYEKGLLYWL
jgi:hypothetical protein